jgi:DNA-binding HxlR family transcriptional regulator
MIEFRYGTDLVRAVSGTHRPLIIKKLYCHEFSFQELAETASIIPEVLDMHLDILQSVNLVSRRTRAGTERIALNPKMTRLVGNFLQNTAL